MRAHKEIVAEAVAIIGAIAAAWQYLKRRWHAVKELVGLVVAILAATWWYLKRRRNNRTTKTKRLESKQGQRTEVL